MNYHFLLLMISVILFSNQCKQVKINDNAKSDVIQQVDQTPVDTIEEAQIVTTYDYTNYSVIMHLPINLTEISGLTYRRASNTLFTVNDEKGDLYELDAISGEIIDKIKFENSGDFEGLEIVGNKCYVLKSNGKIYKIDLNDKVLVDEYKTSLERHHDAEGLAYSRDSNSLIIALKGAPFGKGKETNKVKSLVSFNLDTKVLEPLIDITDEALLQCFSKNYAEDESSKYNEQKLIGRLKAFSPSAVAVQEGTKDMFILSARGSVLVVAGNNEVKQVYFLNDKILAQPEGICFDQDQNLYISSEGKSLIGRILVYEPNQNK